MDEISSYINADVLQDVIYTKNWALRLRKICNQNFKNVNVMKWRRSSRWMLRCRQWAARVYTVHLLSFRTGIIKSICVKEMTLLFRFRHTSLPTVHTDLHGHTASGCLCRSRPLQWCLMYLSRLSGCPKSSQRDAPSSGISLLGTKSNQQVLNLANTEGGPAQSLFVGPKTAWRLSRCGTERCRAKGTSHQAHTCPV